MFLTLVSSLDYSPHTERTRRRLCNNCLRAVRSLGDLLLAGWLLAGCASSVPPTIRTAPPGSPELAQARADVERFIGAQVRWGGTIAAVENRSSETWIQVVGRELGSNGRPRESDRSAGRFIARSQGFLDPEIYAKGRLLTVFGTVTGQMTRNIGDYSYQLPVVRVESLHLWEPLPRYRPYYYDPFWYYEPWYPYPHSHSWRYHPYWW